jgi:Flp pilus assembly protein TadD
MFRQQAANAYYLAGRREYLFGSKESAVYLLEAATRHRHTNALAHHYLALAYADLGQWDKAEAAIATASRVDPNNPAVIENVKRIHNREFCVLPEAQG